MISFLFMPVHISIFQHISRWTLLLFIFLSLTVQIRAQQAADSSSKTNDWVLGLSMTATGYYGDLNYNEEGIFNSDFFSFYPGFNLSFRSGAPRRLNLQLEFGYGKIVSQNPDLPATIIDMGDGFPALKIQPNKYTETFMVHNNLGFRINLIRQPKAVKPYLGIGLGILAFFPQSETGIPLVRKVSTRLPSEDLYNTITVQLPLTAGVEFNLNERLGINFSYTYRMTGTDYIDNIGGLGAQEGNDQLHILQLGASIHFINRPEKAQRARSKGKAISHPLFSHQLEDPLPTETPNPTAIIPGLQRSQAEVAPNIFEGDLNSNCDSLSEVLGGLEVAMSRMQAELDSLKLEIATEKVKKEAGAEGWEAQSYLLLGELVERNRERDSLLNLQDKQQQLQAENQAFQQQLEALKEQTEDYADQLSFEAMKSENAYLIREVERLTQALQEKQLAHQIDSQEVSRAALLQQNTWLAKELARTRQLMLERNKNVQIDTLRIMDSLLVSGQKEGIFVDISGFRVAMLVKGSDPIEKIKQSMQDMGFRSYREEGSWMFDYVKIDEIGPTVYRLAFDTELFEDGFYQVTAVFQPEVGRVSISRYMQESRKAREWVVQLIK